MKNGYNKDVGAKFIYGAVVTGICLFIFWLAMCIALIGLAVEGYNNQPKRTPPPSAVVEIF